MQAQTYKKVLSNGVVFGVLASIVMGAYSILMPKFERRAMLEEQRKELAQKTDDKKKAIESLKIMQDRFENDETFVEYVARQNRRIRKNEFIFIYANE